MDMQETDIIALVNMYYFYIIENVAHNNQNQTRVIATTAVNMHYVRLMVNHLIARAKMDILEMDIVVLVSNIIVTTIVSHD